MSLKMTRPAFGGRRKAVAGVLALAAPLVGIAFPVGAEPNEPPTEGLLPPGSVKPTHPAPLNYNGDTDASVNADLYRGKSAAGSDARLLAGLCDVNYACAFVDANYGGRRGQFAQANSTWYPFANNTCFSGNWKNCASSASNSKVSDTFYMFADDNYNGAVWGVAPGNSFSSLGAFDNEAQSNFF
jgi:hypothetical protein